MHLRANNGKAKEWNKVDNRHQGNQATKKGKQNNQKQRSEQTKQTNKLQSQHWIPWAGELLVALEMVTLILVNTPLTIQSTLWVCVQAQTAFLTVRAWWFMCMITGGSKFIAHGKETFMGSRTRDEQYRFYTDQTTPMTILLSKQHGGIKVNTRIAQQMYSYQ